ncbi:MAG: elongation factor P [Candidatus Paceibacterota bacterium]|jgi:elongation factor P|nr:elongation factor P [Candidatus Paceibacterota bacterium]MDD4830536.1 elongation factor P [Candidatus Paceibacterota bacterium]MDD4874795.1 elongation factor P [Candidatus Paceibacterota bacterium]
MINYFALKKGVQFIMDGVPYEIVESQPAGKAQDVFVIKAKIKNLITGKITDKSFHQSDRFEEAELEKVEVKFIYANRGKYVFCGADDPKNRFELPEDLLGDSVKFVKSDQIIEGLRFEGKIINISLPIKVQLKVAEAAPGVKGDRAQGGTKIAVLETGTQINVPLFVEAGDIVEVNTSTGEYSKRV